MFTTVTLDRSFRTQCINVHNFYCTLYTLYNYPIRRDAHIKSEPELTIQCDPKEIAQAKVNTLKPAKRGHLEDLAKLSSLERCPIHRGKG
jgi:hypothetical protein